MLNFQLEAFFIILLTVSWVSGQECGNIRLAASHGTLTSPNYPKRYDHKSNCTWTIVAPENHFIEIRFDDFDIKNPFWECDLDYVTVFYDADRSQRFCNYQKPPEIIKSTSNTITLKLTSDHFYFNGIGFSATFDVFDKYGNKLEEEEKTDEETEEQKDKPSGESLASTLNKFVNKLTGRDDEAASSTTTTTTTAAATTTTTTAVTTTTTAPTTTTQPTTTTAAKPKSRKGRKGRKGKKLRKSREERRRERRLRRQKAKALRQKNKKGKGGKKTKRAPKRRHS